MGSWADKYPGVPVSQQVVPGHPARALIGLSARADLVVMGRRGEHPGPHGPGPVRHAVLSHAHGPIAVIPSGRWGRRGPIRLSRAVSARCACAWAFFGTHLA